MGGFGCSRKVLMNSKLSTAPRDYFQFWKFPCHRFHKANQLKTSTQIYPSAVKAKSKTKGEGSNVNAANRQRDTFAWSCTHRDFKVHRKIHFFRPNLKYKQGGQTSIQNSSIGGIAEGSQLKKHTCNTRSQKSIVVHTVICTTLTPRGNKCSFSAR